MAQRETKINSTHLAYLDGLRAVAALYVVIHHFGETATGRASSLLSKIFTYAFYYGHYAVNLFIVLSGFCLMLPVVRNKGGLRSSGWEFIRRRAQRILPPYYLAIILCLVLINTVIGERTGYIWDYSIPVTRKDILTHLLLIHDIFRSSCGKIDGPLWSVSVEWRIYLFFPALITLWRRWGAFWVTTTVVVLSSVGWVALQAINIDDLNKEQFGICPHYFGLFTMGMLAAQIVFSTDTPFINLRQTWPWSLLLSAASIAVLGATAMYKALPWLLTDLLVGVWALCLLVYLSGGGPNVIRKALSWPPMVFVGTFAYSIYLMHSPFQQLFRLYILAPMHLGVTATTLATYFIGLPLVMLGSYLFFRMAERPFLPKTSNRTPVKPAPTPVF